MLSIDWTASHLRIVDGKSSGTGIAVRQSVAVPIPQEVDPANVEALGQFLRLRLDEARIASRQAVSCLDRRHLVLKTVPLVDVADDEVPEVVRLQAMRDLTLSIEEIAYDFVRIERGRAGREPYALLAAVKSEIIAATQQVFANAGIKLVGLWPSTLARTWIPALFVSGWDEPTEGDGLQLLIVPDGESVELIVLEEGRFVASVSRLMNRPTGEKETETPAANPLLQAVRRMEASLATQYPSLKIGTVAVAGFDGLESAIVDDLAGQLGAKLAYFDPLAGQPGCDVPVSQRGAFAGVVGGLALSAAPARQRINFLAPKRTVVKTDRRRLAAIGLVGLMAFGGMQTLQYTRRESSRLEAAATTAKNRERVLANELKQLAPAVAQADVLDEWLAGEVVWLEVLRKLTAAAPERLVLTSITLADVARGEQAGLVRIEGVADSQKTIAELSRRLHATGGFEVRTGPIQPAKTAGPLGWQFSADVAVLHEPEKSP
jgi:Tfp pilus assembly protein PilN